MTAIEDIKIDLFEKQDENFPLYPDWDELTAITPLPETIEIPKLPAPTVIPWPDSYPTAKQMLAEIDVQPVEFPTVAQIEAELAQRTQAWEEALQAAIKRAGPQETLERVELIKKVNAQAATHQKSVNEEAPEDELVAGLALKPSPIKRATEDETK